MTPSEKPVKGGMVTSSRRRKLAFCAMILAAILVLLLIAWFLFLRITDSFIAEQDKSMLVYDFHALRRQVLLPDQVFDRDGVYVSINQYGMRGRAPEMPKPEGTYRIFVMGGSSVFDHNMGNGESWPERIGAILDEVSAERVECFNAGIPGYCTRETLAFYCDKIRYLSPDMVILYQGWNDMKYMTRFREGVDVDSFFHITDFTDHNKLFTAPRPVRNWHAMRLMIERLRSSDEHLHEGRTLQGSSTKEEPPSTNPNASVAELEAEWAGTKGMRFFEQNVEAFVQAVLSDGAIPVLVPQNTLATENPSRKSKKKIAYKWAGMDHKSLVAVNEAMVGVLEKVAKRQGVPFVDLRDRMNGKLEFFLDHVHFDPKGSRRFAALFFLAMAHRFDPKIDWTDSDSPAEASSSVVGYWPCDGIYDTWVRGAGPQRLHGSVRGGVTLVAEGKRGGALRFDGVTGEMVIEDSAALHLGADFLIQAWIKLDPGAGEKKSMGIVIKGGEYYLAVRRGKLAFIGYGLKPKQWCTADRPLPIGEWVHVAARCDGSSLALLVNNEVVFTQPVTGCLGSIDSPLIIGGLNGFFEGEIDEVRIETLP